MDYRECILITERIGSNGFTGRNFLFSLLHILSIAIHHLVSVYSRLISIAVLNNVALLRFSIIYLVLGLFKFGRPALIWPSVKENISGEQLIGSKGKDGRKHKDSAVPNIQI